MKVTVVGTGYVGLVTGAGLAARGHTVVCVDIDPRRVATIARGEPPFHEPGLPALLADVLASGRFAVTTRLDEAIAASDCSILAVGTPPDDAGRIDLAAIERAAGEVGTALGALGRYHVVVVKSTVVPGTTDGVVRAAVERASGLAAGEFGLCMNPEFLREGSAVADFSAPDRIVVGQWDERSGGVLAALYRDFDCPKLFTTLRNAEMIKYAANALLATMVSFSNELAALCEAVGDVDEATVMAGVHLDRRLTPPERPSLPPGILTYLRAGIGFGGSCLPKDVSALRAFASARGLPTPLLDAVLAVNRERPGRVLGLLEAALGGLAGRTVAVLGIAFKPGTDDVRDSPALALIRALRARGAAVRAHDPMVRAVAGLDGVVVAPDAASALAGADGVLVATAWPEFRALDWPALVACMRRPIVLDGRSLLDPATLPAGVTYLRIGRAPAGGERSSA